MTATGADHRSTANTEPRLLRIKVNGKACYAFKWHDVRVETRREVNYVLRDPIAGVVQCLLVNCPLRIAASPELVSVQSTGRSLVRNGAVWEFAQTVWQCGATDDEGTIRFCPPAQFPDRSLRNDLNRMIREHNEGARKCEDLTISQRAPSAISPVKAVVPPATASTIKERKIAEAAQRRVETLAQCKIDKARARCQIAEARAAQAEKQSKGTGALVEKAVNECLAPFLPALERAVEIVTPPSKRKWWENVRELFKSFEPGRSKGATWLAVAVRVVERANAERKKLPKDREYIFFSPRMFQWLLKQLDLSGANSSQIATHYAGKLRRMVEAAEAKAKK